MGQVDAFEIQGLKLWFNSSDHTPPHLHVSRRGKWEVRVMILDAPKTHLCMTLNGAEVDRRALTEIKSCKQSSTTVKRCFKNGK